MSKFRNSSTGVIVSVADSKDARFGDGWVSADAQPEPAVKPSVRTKKFDK